MIEVEYDRIFKVLQSMRTRYEQREASFKNFANYCWAPGKRRDAIEALRRLIVSRRFAPSDENREIELRSLLLMYHSALAIQEKDEIKELYKYQEIEYREFTERNTQLRNQFLRIINEQGHPLFARILARGGMEGLSSAARQNPDAVMYQPVDVYTRVNKRTESIELCEYFVKMSPDYMQTKYERKRAWLQSVN
jgi:hypothetical protein